LPGQVNRINPNGFCDINFIRQGQGQPVILVHGIAASLQDWSDLACELRESGLETIALDLPGHGDSCKPDGLDPYHLEILFDTMVEWIRTLELNTPPILIGHSMGGYLILEYALRYPDQTLGLILIDPFFSPDQIPFLVRVGHRKKIISASAHRNLPGWFYGMIVDATSFLNPGRYFLKHDLSQEVRKKMAENYRKAAPGIFRLPFTARNLEPHLPHIVTPTMVIYGIRDTTLDPHSFERLINLLPNAEGKSLKAGHVPHQSNPEETHQLILDFIARAFKTKDVV
jgi:pimeloyl-ACP methyl ester carboxylesterase